ncbi:MAG: 3-dehydroquinate dehydratase, partial [Neisseria sicca]|nr:3-dehydroquinate dehydratase [Neisseria sicca]
TFGSTITFGTAGTASAPGQLDSASLKNILDVLENSGVAG